jgi:uncharacterized protein
MEAHETVAWGGFLIGLAFGGVGQRTGFCLTSGMKGLAVTGDGRKARSFALALAVALLGSQALAGFGGIDLHRSLYVQPAFSPLLVASGGLLFGYGMIMANGCGARSLVLLGSGNLRAFVVLVCLGIAAFVTLTGLLAPMRVLLASLGSVEIAGAAATLAGVFGGGPAPGAGTRLLVAAALALPLGLWAFADRAFRASSADWIGGAVVGALVCAGWFVTGHLGADDFTPAPLASLTFVAPIGEAIQFAMLATGMSLGFGVAVVAGVVLGAIAAALASGTFRLEGFATPERMLRSMGGGALMGVGGAAALGCSIGQGLTGLSTLALPSFFAASGILLGAVLALRGPARLPLL